MGSSTQRGYPSQPLNLPYISSHRISSFSPVILLHPSPFPAIPSVDIPFHSVSRLDLNPVPPYATIGIPPHTATRISHRVCNQE
jgi:hypothetical protein